MFFSTELLFKIKIETTRPDFDVQTKTDVFNVFMIIRLKYYHDSLNLAVTVALGCQVVTFSLLSMCLILFNIYGMQLNKGGFSSKTVMIHF